MLPRLIRDLVYATTERGTLGLLIMPYGDDINIPGLDGRVRLSEEHSHIPRGESAWEISVGADCSKKAQDNYRKRTGRSNDVVPKHTTFVFVTPHVWREKDAWVERRKSEGHWLDVRVIDGITLSDWICGSPPVTARLFNDAAMSVDDIDDIDLCWKRGFGQAIHEFVSSSFLTDGRDEQCESLRKWLEVPRDDLTIVASSPLDVRLFVAAAIKQAREKPGENGFAQNVVFIRDRSARPRLQALHYPQIAMLSDPDLAADFQLPKLQCVHLIIPKISTSSAVRRTPTPRIGPVPGQIFLPPLRRGIVENELHRLRFKPEEASRIATDSQGNLESLLREIKNDF